MTNSTADAAKYFEEQGDKEVEKLFWSQFNAPNRSLPLNENVAALKAAEELSAEQPARRRSEEEMAEMAVELKNVADRYALLEKENKASSAELDKALNAAKEMRTEIRSMREELQ